MTGVDKLTVSISLGGQMIELGELVSTKEKIYFRYYPEFIDRGIQISPFRMPLSDKPLTANREPFEGLFGVFSDSLPDGWGRLLLDRTLSSRGISPLKISPLDRLAYVGSGGMGTLIYKPESGLEHNLKNKLELDSIARQMNQVLEGTSSDVFEELYALGGSSGGARPKILVGYDESNDNLIHGSGSFPEGYEHWIIKFPSSSDPIDIAFIEYAYYKMALGAGIEMNPCRLFTGESGRKYFGTKRFDRVEGQRLHMHSASGLMHDDFRLSNMDYGHLMDSAFKLENQVEAYNKVLRLAAFNIYGHNRDDHSKNFSFLMDPEGNWQLAPAYDLTFSSSSHGLHSTMIAGESKAPGRKHLLELAKHFSMKDPAEIIERVQGVFGDWSKYASENGVEKKSSDLINKTILQLRD